LSDWIKHTPPEVLAKNFGMPASDFAKVPAPEDLYIFASAPPKPLSQENPRGVPTIPGKFSHRLLAQKPVAAGNSGSVRIADSSIFPASKTIAAAYVEVAPGAMREMHWHPNNDEWQYYIEGQGRMTVFAAQGQARTFDYRAGDVGYVPFATGHYIENTGTTPLRFLEIFKSDYYADVSFNQWLAVSPPELVKAHLNVDQAVIDGLRTTKTPIVPA
jgi:oxalate decarboxylase